MSQVEEDFRVELNIFRGPLDLLLYLVRKHELEVADIPIAEVLDQYLEFLDIMEQLSIDAVGDFLDLASTLTEIKSRLVLLYFHILKLVYSIQGRSQERVF